jgi:hypothetical protein
LAEILINWRTPQVIEIDLSTWIVSEKFQQGERSHIGQHLSKREAEDAKVQKRKAKDCELDLIVSLTTFEMELKQRTSFRSRPHDFVNI